LIEIPPFFPFIEGTKGRTAGMIGLPTGVSNGSDTIELKLRWEDNRILK
jgi:hypothetical protein